MTQRTPRSLSVLLAIAVLATTARPVRAASSGWWTQLVVPGIGLAVAGVALLRFRLTHDQQIIRTEYAEGDRYMKAGEYRLAMQSYNTVIQTYENSTSPRVKGRKEMAKLHRKAKQRFGRAQKAYDTSQADANQSKPAQPSEKAQVSPAPPASETSGLPQPFETDSGWGYRRADGSTLVPATFAMAQEFTTAGIAAAVDDTGWVLLDTAGTRLLRPYAVDNGPDYFAEGMARYVADGMFGFFDTTGAVVIKAAYDYAEPFVGAKAAVCSGCSTTVDGEHSRVVGGNWGVINADGSVAVALEHGRARVLEGGTVLTSADGDTWDTLGAPSVPGATGHETEVSEDTLRGEKHYRVWSGDDTLTWTVRTTGADRGSISRATACDSSGAAQGALASVILPHVLQDTAAVGLPATLFWGRLQPCAGANHAMVVPLIEAALASDAWNAQTGTPFGAGDTDVVAELLRKSGVFDALAAAFAAHGLTCTLSHVEKVLVGTLEQAGVALDGVADTVKVPFDCQVWFTVEPADGVGQSE